MPRNKRGYKIVKRKIKYPRLELKTGELVVVVPHDGDFDVPEFVNRHQDWIANKQKLIKKFRKKNVVLRRPPLKKEELRTLIMKYIVQFNFGNTLCPKKIIIKTMKSKWGSCSAGRNLCFNFLLSHLPDRMIKYIVCHEMCHLKHRKHDHNFKLLLSSYYKKLDKFESDLFVCWFKLSSEKSCINLC